MPSFAGWDELTARACGLSNRAFRQDAGVGVALGVPLVVPSFGQFACVPVPSVVDVDGAVDPSDGVVLVAGVGLADGSGLAAETTAAPPAIRSAAAIPPVSAARRKPPMRLAGAGAAASAGWSVWSEAGIARSSFGSIWISFGRGPAGGDADLDAGEAD
jgi:hypothetical protein